MRRPIVISLAAVLLVAACDDGEAPAPSSTAFTFLVLSDTHVRLPGLPDAAVYDSQGNLDQFAHMVGRINAEFGDAAFVMVTGDLVGCLYSADPADYGPGADNPATRFRALTGPLSMPCHVALGNHDYETGFDSALRQGISAADTAGVEAVWRAVLGIEPYYAFVHNGVRFIVLNSNRGPVRDRPCPAESRECGCQGSFDDAQLEWLQAQFLNPEPCLLFLHHPVITDHNAAAGWSILGEAFQVVPEDRFYDIVFAFRERIRGVFVGHGHAWAQDTLYETIPVYETGALGDVPSSGDNVHVVRVDPARDRYTVTSGNPADSLEQGLYRAVRP